MDLEVRGISNYPQLIDALLYSYGFINKEQLAQRVDVASKTIYNIANGEPVGRYAKRKLNIFLTKGG